MDKTIFEAPKGALMYAVIKHLREERLSSSKSDLEQMLNYVA